MLPPPPLICNSSRRDGLSADRAAPVVILESDVGARAVMACSVIAGSILVRKMSETRAPRVGRAATIVAKDSGVDVSHVIKTHINANMGTVSLVIGSSESIVSLIDVHGMTATVTIRVATTEIDASLRAVDIVDNTPPARHPQVRNE